MTGKRLLIVAHAPSPNTRRLRDAVAAAEPGRPALPVTEALVHVPAGYAVARVHVRAMDEVRVASGVRLDAVRAGLPAAALDPDSDLLPARSGASLGGGHAGGFALHAVGLFPVRWNAPRQTRGCCTARHLRPVTMVSTPRRVPVPSWPARM